jgi:hypothetical protein
MASQKARFNQETRDFIEGLFATNNYDIDRQISYLEIRERQMWHYESDCPGCADQSAWNEIIDMLNERKANA